MPYLFEARFARYLYETGLDIEHEYKAGAGGSNIDFLIKEKNGVKWLIELTSLDESEEVKKKTKVGGGFFSFESTISPADTGNNVESLSLIRAQRRILSKVATENKATKFFAPKADEYNIIIIDMRGFITKTSDEYDYRNILYGWNKLNDHEKELYGRFFIAENGEKKPILGIFDSSHPDKRAKYLQERIHGVGFICEKTYKHGEIQGRLILFHNPKLFKTREELINLWPIRDRINI
jgi:hypothetical protein